MAKAGLKERRAARKEQKRVQKTAKLGSGKRFAAVEKAAAAGGARDPGAVAATAGRRKHGKAKMAKWSAAGRKRAGKRTRKVVST